MLGGQPPGKRGGQALDKPGRPPARRLLVLIVIVLVLADAGLVRFHRPAIVYKGGVGPVTAAAGAGDPACHADCQTQAPRTSTLPRISHRGPEPGIAALELGQAQLGLWAERTIFDQQRASREPTLGICGMVFPGGLTRVARIEKAYQTGDFLFTDEIVRYRSGGAQEMLSETRYAAAHCQRGPVFDPAAGSSFVYRVTPVAMPGLLADSSAWSETASCRSCSTTADYVVQVRGDFLSLINAYGPDVRTRAQVAQPAAMESAGLLQRLIPDAGPPVPATPIYRPFVASSALGPTELT